MDKKRPLSYSSISTYSQCGQKYKLRYIDGYRSKYHRSALCFGSAIDTAINSLLLSKDLSNAKNIFINAWKTQELNNLIMDLSVCEEVLYNDDDFDEDLLLPEDIEEILAFVKANNIKRPDLGLYRTLLGQIQDSGWDSLSSAERQLFNKMNWHSLKQKGLIILNSYASKILPYIKEVIAVQKKNTISNADQDLEQHIDLIARWGSGKHNNSVVLFDHKTSARNYEPNSAGLSFQLISYYFGMKKQYSIDKVGFIVFNKNIVKNKQKTCSTCKFDGTGFKHPKCNNTVDGKRCNGAWDITVSPECYIQVIINDIQPTVEQLVLDAIDDGAHGIKNETFTRNLNSCKIGKNYCEYYKHCWYKDNSDITKKKR